MTIVDVMLHKWRMLDDRRRRMIWGFILLAIIVLVVVIFVVRAQNKSQPEPTPQPEPQPTTPAPTPEPTPEPEPPLPPTKVTSEDRLALASLVANLITHDETFEIASLDKLEFTVLPDQKEADKKKLFTLTFKAMSVAIIGNFVKLADGTTEAEQVGVTWKGADEATKECKLVKQATQQTGFFHADSGKHYRCAKPTTYECQNDDGTTKASLVLVNLEFELDRNEPVAVDMEFETPAQDCTVPSGIVLRAERGRPIGRALVR